MKSLIKVALVPALVLTVAACGGKGDDSLGDNVADAYDAKADNVEDMADNAATETQQDALENKADALRDEGKRKEEAIDRSDVDTRGMSAAQKESVANKM